MVCFAPPASAAFLPVAAETQAHAQSGDAVRARIQDLWFERKEALETGDTMLAQARVEEMRALLAQEGITADRDIARGFAYEGYENLREGNYERAREAYHVAGSFDPYLPQARMGYAWSLLRSGHGVVAFINEYFRGIGLAWSSLVTDEIELTNLIVVAAATLMFSSMMFSLVVVARCQGRLRHDLVELLRRKAPDSFARWLSWVVFLLPLLIWTGGIWAVLYWLALCFRYMRVPERVVAAMVFLMLGLSPLGAAHLLDQFEASTDPDIRVVVEAMQAGFNPESVRRLGKLVSAHADSPEIHLLLGNLHAKGDQLAEAFDEYRRVLDLSSSSTPALVNLGNVYFRLGEYGQAVAHYKQAAQIRPDLAAAYWNMHLAQGELLHFAEAEVSLAKARDLDAASVGRLLADQKDGGPAILQEQPADLARIKSELRSRMGPDAPLEALFAPVSLASGSALSIALLLSLGGKRAQACARCGRSHCQRCAMNTQDGLCPRCMHLFRRKDGITAEVRAEEMRRLARRDKATGLIRRAASAVLPGSAHIMSGRLGVGLPVMMLWSAVIMFLLAWDRLLLLPRVPVSDLPPPAIVVSFILLAALWIAGNMVSTRPPSNMELTHGA